MVFPVADGGPWLRERHSPSLMERSGRYMLNMWPCGWSRRKNCCRCLKSARGHRRSWHLWPLCRRLPVCRAETLLASLAPGVVSGSLGDDGGSGAAYLDHAYLAGLADASFCGLTETGELVWACLALRLRMQIEVWQPEVAQDEQKLTQLLGAVAGLLEQVALGLHPDWPGLCLLAHKRTEKNI